MNILGMLTGGGTKDLIEGVGGVIYIHRKKKNLKLSKKLKR